MLIKEKLEQLMIAHWTEFVNRSELIKFALQQARNHEYPTNLTDIAQFDQVRISITKISLDSMNLWIEFSIPSEGGTIIGTHICSFSFDGDLNLQESIGTNLKQRPKSGS